MKLLDIQTERLLLRKIHVNDFAAFAEYYDHPEVCELLFGYSNIDDTTIAAAFDFNLELELCFSIVLKSINKVIGNIHFVNITEHYLAEVGYIMHPDYWGQGYMAEALAATINFAFEDYGLAKIRAITETSNAASIRLLKCCGFVHEVTLHEAAYGGKVTDVGHFYLDKRGKNESN